MNHKNFYLRAASLLVILAAIAGYNLIQKEQAQTQELAELTKKVTMLESQQTELLTAMQQAADKKKEQASEKEDDTTSAQSDVDEETEEDSSAQEGLYVDGTYTGEGAGFGGTIQVELTLKNQEMTDIQIISASGEDSAYLSQAQGVIDAILTGQTTAVDTVSGATFSSTGIIQAVNDALGKAENS